jgi:hypothetical protein
MKTRLWICLTAFTLLVVVSGCRSLTIAINDTNPPVFSFSASRFAECCDHLTFLTVWEVEPAQSIHTGGGKVIWQIWPLSGTDNSASGLPAITYGTVPPGFVQKVPEVGSPVRLEEGKEYEAAGPLIEVPEAYVRFRIEKGKAVLMSSRN